MFDELSIGSTPSDEPCAQVGQENYSKLSRIEGKAFINQLLRQFPLPENVRATLVVKGAPHDYGTYHEVYVKYDSDDKEAIKYAYKLEAETPSNWDAEALAELAKAGYHFLPNNEVTLV